jgi:hypothetical protein
VELPRIFDNYIELGDGRELNYTHNKLVVGNTTNVPVTWTLTGPFNIGTRIQIAGGWHLGGPVSINVDPADIHSFIFSVGSAQTVLNLLGTDQGALYCVDGHIWLWTGLRHYVTPTFVPTPNTFVGWPHGLGFRPQKLILRMTCQVAELNYTVGDVIHLGASASDSNCGIMIKCTATNVYARIGAGGVKILSAAGISTLITPANWACVVRAELVN